MDFFGQPTNIVNLPLYCGHRPVTHRLIEIGIFGRPKKLNLFNISVGNPTSLNDKTLVDRATFS